jgi:hypothetical protein
MDSYIPLAEPVTIATPLKSTSALMFPVRTIILLAEGHFNRADQPAEGWILFALQVAKPLFFSTGSRSVSNSPRVSGPIPHLVMYPGFPSKRRGTGLVYV